ncbi:hypothetical protein ACTXT7_008947 [Hymenolepis weldensis]
MLICCPKRSALVDDKGKEPQEIGLVKPVSFIYGTRSKVIVQNASKGALYYHQDLPCFRTYIHWSHINLNLAGSIPRISYLVLADLKFH